MANMCGNWVRISKTDEDVKQFVELVGEEFDFGKVIPLDNYTKNELIEKLGCNGYAYDTIYDGSCFNKGEASWFFWTNWNPPYKIYEALRSRFPDIYFYWRYEVPGSDLYGYLQNEKIQKENEKWNKQHEQQGVNEIDI
jgi:hypothetical protein